MSSNIRPSVTTVNGFSSATINTDTTTTGTGVDLQGYDRALVIVRTTTHSAGTITPRLSDSETDSSYAAVDAEFVYPTQAAISAANAPATYEYTGKKRWLRVDLVSGSSANVVAHATVLKLNARHQPTA